MFNEQDVYTDEEILERLKTTGRTIVIISDLDTVNVEDLYLDYKVDAILVVIHYGDQKVSKEILSKSFKEVIVYENRFDTFEDNFYEENLGVLRKFRNTTFIIISRSKTKLQIKNKLVSELSEGGNDFLMFPKLYPYTLKEREI